jgi:membrane protease YdiL (CAAX protease family)
MVIDGPPPRPDLGDENLGWRSADAVVTVHGTGINGGPPVGWSFWEALGLFFIVYLLIGQMVLGAVTLALMNYDFSQAGDGGASAPLLAATLVGNVATVALVSWWLSRRYPNWLASLGIGKPAVRSRDVLLAIVLAPAIYLVLGLVVAPILSALIEGLSNLPTTTPDQIDAQSLSTAGKILAVVATVIVAPITEEFMFRGLLFRSLRDRHGFWLGAVVSAVMFGFVHWSGPWQDAVLLVGLMTGTGFALAAIYQWRGSIVATIATHMVFNIIGLTLILTTS